MAGGIVAMGISGCGFLDVEDIELGQLPMVTETGEWSSPVDTAGHLCNWMESKSISATNMIYRGNSGIWHYWTVYMPN